MPKQKAAAKKPAPSASAADQAVDAANKRCDALDKRSDLAAFQGYTCSDFTVRLETCTVASIPKELQDWAYDLCKTNMEAMYKKVWGWNNNKKRRQFAAPASRFCVAFLDREGQQPEPVGYVNYRWDGGAAAGGRGRARPPASRLHAKPAAQSARPPSPPRPAPTCRPPWPPLAPHLPTRQAATPPSGAGPCPPPHTPATPALTRAPPPLPNLPRAPARYESEGGSPVLYCYELQLVEAVRHRGLGPRFMALLETLAAAAGMGRVMLTVSAGAGAGAAPSGPPPGPPAAPSRPPPPPPRRKRPRILGLPPGP
jgi:hypothetical protein